MQTDIVHISSGKKRNFVIHRIVERLESAFHEHPVGQLLFAESGIIHLEFKDRKLLLPSQYCAWIPPFVSHRIWSANASLLVRNIYFESHFCKNPFFRKPAVFLISKVLKEMIRYSEKWNGTIEQHYQETTFLTAIRQMIPEMISNPLNIDLPVCESPLLNNILSFIQKNMHQEILINTVAVKFNISTKTLQRLFSKELGCSFSTYLKHLRILTSIELLALQKSVKEITYEVGYNSIPTFSHAFKELTGVAPKQFLNNNN